MEDYKLAARYSFMPNKLRYCGPEEADWILHDYVAEGKNYGLVKEIMEKFDALVLYLKLIAKNNNKHHFDKEVIESYWIGNKLIENVDKEQIKDMIINDFTKKGLPFSVAKNLADNVPGNIVPHHSFHVFHIHSISGKLIPVSKNLDKCRISSGKVKRILDDKIIVEYIPLIAENGNLNFGKLTEKEISYNRKFIPNLKINDNIAIHWDFAVDRLTDEQVKNLDKYTKMNLGAMDL